mgnify:CR=1 FL=1
MNLKKFLITLVTGSLIFPQMSGASVHMSLSQYVREILVNNPSLQSGIKSVEADYYSVLASVGSQRLQVGASSGFTWISKVQGKDNYTAGNIGITLTKRIDISNSFTLDQQQNILGYEISRAQFDNALNDLIATAEETWWGAVLARENVKLQREILLQRSENHRVTVEKFNQELVPRLDVVRSEAQVVEAEATAKTAETTYQNLLANLSFLAGGLDVEPEEEELRVPEFDIELNQEDALNFRPDVRAAKLTLERAKIAKKLNAKGLSPTLDFAFTGYPWSDPKTSTTPNGQQVMGNLSLNFPLFNGRQTKYKVLNSDRLIQSAEANLKYLQETTKRDIIVALNNWKEAASSEHDKKRQVERSEEELRITELMYAEGMGAQIDLINAQTAYQSVRTEYLDAVKNMYVALVDLRKAIGDYSPDENGDWDEAVARYAKGNDIQNETGVKNLRTDTK